MPNRKFIMFLAVFLLFALSANAALMNHTASEIYPGTFIAGTYIFPSTSLVGIGTTIPTAKLHIGGVAGTDGIRFPDGTLQTTAASGSSAAGWTDDGANVRLTTSTDNVGIGTASPTYKLDVAGDIRINGAYRINSSVGQGNTIVAGSSSCGGFTLYYDFAGGILVNARRVYNGDCAPPPVYEPGCCPSTPYIFAWDNNKFVPVSDFLFGSPQTNFKDYETGLEKYIAGLVGDDMYVLAHNPSLKDGKYILQIREIELENTYLDSFSLVKVSHSKNTMPVVDSEFKKLYVLSDDSLEDLVPPSSIKNEQADAQHKLEYITFSSKGGGKMIIEPIIRLQSPNIIISIEYQPKGSSEWKLITKVTARQPNYTPYLVELPEDLDEPFTLRLSTLDDVDIKGIGILKEFEPKQYTSTILRLHSAVNINSGNNVSDLIMRKDNVLLRLRTGEKINLVFSDAPLTGEKISFVIKAGGFYTDIDASKHSDPRGSRLTLLTQWLEERVNVLENELLHLNSNYETAAANQLQMNDRATGELYCIYIEEGQLVKEKGKCN